MTHMMPGNEKVVVGDLFIKDIYQQKNQYQLATCGGI
jgi:hypothetical protein